jgi:hypothetical protein
VKHALENQLKLSEAQFQIMRGPPNQLKVEIEQDGIRSILLHRSGPSFFHPSVIDEIVEAAEEYF